MPSSSSSIERSCNTCMRVDDYIPNRSAAIPPTLEHICKSDTRSGATKHRELASLRAAFACMKAPGPLLSLARAIAFFFCLAFSGYVSDARAASFLSASYDAENDEIVVTLAYRGTNPNHEFTLTWGECQTTAEGAYEIAARLNDSQWKDRARKPFERTVRFPLTNLRCRPATVTLHTEPNFRISVNVPARGDADRDLRGPHTDAH